jgi:uncharacterized iron-regulated protein
MRKIILLSLAILLMMNNAISAQNDEAKYQIFDAKGNNVTLERILDSIEKSDVVFLGEQHDDAIAHRLQMQIFSAGFEKYKNSRKAALSLEMFERDVQTVVDEYLQNLITETHFISSSRAWGNYKTDYRPLVEFAKLNNLEVIAANAPRRYVNMVSRLGRNSLEKLSPEAKKWIAPLPFGDASPEYAKKFNALMGAMPDAANRHSPMLDAQVLWDATMAYSIAESLKKEKNKLIFHLNGSFHTENRLGTVEHLLKYRPQTKALVITMRYEDDFRNFDKSKHTDLGDFVILTDARQPRSSR